MSRSPRAIRVALPLLVASACGDTSSAPEVPQGGAALRIINADSAAVDVVVDGVTALAALAPSAISPPLAVGAGGRRVELRRAGGVVADVRVSLGATDTLTAAARPQGGRTQAMVLADTGRLVPAGASKLRVVHLAAGAPPLDVWRTQPDFVTPITIMFPFRYAAESPYLQSTPGSWEVRVSRGSGAADGRPVAGGWNASLARLVVPVPERQARTVVVLDAPDRGVRLTLLEQP